MTDDVILFIFSSILTVFGLLILIFKLPLVAGLDISNKRNRIFSGLMLTITGVLFFVAFFIRDAHPQQAIPIFIAGIGFLIVWVVGIQNLKN